MDRLQINPDIKSKIMFTKVNPNDKGIMSFYIVYSVRITIADAVSLVSKLASSDKITDVALLLRGIFMCAFKETNTLHWPPTAEDLSIKSHLLQDELQKSPKCFDWKR